MPPRGEKEQREIEWTNPTRISSRKKTHPINPNTPGKVSRTFTPAGGTTTTGFLEEEEADPGNITSPKHNRSRSNPLSPI